MIIKWQMAEFLHPWLILCGGNGDKGFFELLIKANGLSGNFDVRTPNEGRGAFGRYLRASHDASETFRNNVHAVLIVSDNDDD